MRGGLIRNVTGRVGATSRFIFRGMGDGAFSTDATPAEEHLKLDEFFKVDLFVVTRGVQDLFEEAYEEPAVRTAFQEQGWRTTSAGTALPQVH